MPQATNRSLVGQMAATPTGPGTVYAALLKSRANNQDRVSRVNESEKIRLQKVKKVMDRNSRHAQWERDQQMEQLRESLVRLEAFRRVLREDFPINKLMRRRGEVYNHEKTGDDNPVTVTENKSQCNQIPRDGHFQPKTKSSEDLHHVSIRLPTKENRQNARRTRTELDGNDKHMSPLYRNRDDYLPQQSKSQDGTKPEASHEIDTAGKIKTNVKPPAVFQKINHDIASKNHGGPKESVTALKTSGQNEASLDPRKQLRMERGIERRKKMEEKIVWRGFDMNTLGNEVRHKMKVMDPKRKRKRFQGQMAAYSRQQNERIIADSRAKFVTQVMSEGVAIEETDDRTHLAVDLNQQTNSAKPTDKLSQTNRQTQPNQQTNSAKPTPTETLETEDEQQGSLNPNSRILQITFNPLLHKIPLM